VAEQMPVSFEGYYSPLAIWVEVSVYPSAHGLSVFFKNINERKHLEQVLQNQQRQLTAAAIAAQEKERALISIELHDNVNQLLTSAKLYAELGRDRVGDPAVMMDKTIALLQNAIDEIRELSSQLSVCFLDQTALEDSIRELTATVSQSSLLTIVLNIDLLPQSSVNADVNLAVYRILQEHLTNVTKHAQAKRVEVTLQQNDGKLMLTVVDDGRGFNPDKKAKGIGLANMRSRAESLMGIFSLKSQPGKGCTLFVQIPVQQ
jgi:signal transduction histidine kinase